MNKNLGKSSMSIAGLQMVCKAHKEKTCFTKCWRRLNNQEMIQPSWDASLPLFFFKLVPRREVAWQILYFHASCFYFLLMVTESTGNEGSYISSVWPPLRHWHKGSPLNSSVFWKELSAILIMWPTCHNFCSITSKLVILAKTRKSVLVMKSLQCTIRMV